MTPGLGIPDLSGALLIGKSKPGPEPWAEAKAAWDRGEDIKFRTSPNEDWELWNRKIYPLGPPWGAAYSSGYRFLTIGTPPSPTPSRYQWQYRGVNFDLYRLCEILGITSHAQAHALKKVIRAGRSSKPLSQDIDESIDALRRWKEMAAEDAAASPVKAFGKGVES